MITAVVKPATISMTNFAMYVSATTMSAKMQCAKEVANRYGQEYSPATDFYHAFRQAMISGRQANSDSFTLRQAIAAQNDPRRVEHYKQMLPAYLAWLGKNPGSYLPLRSTTWGTPNLEVSVTPEYALRRPDGGVDVVKFYLRTDPLTRDGADAMLYILDANMAALLPRGGRPVVVDVRRGKTFAMRKNLRRGYGAALLVEARSLADMWRAVA